MKALYNYRPNRSKGNDIIVDVAKISTDYSEIMVGQFRPHKKTVVTSRLKPYLDPDADGSQWLFLGYIIMKQNHPKLKPFLVLDTEDNVVDAEFYFSEAKKLVIKTILEG